MSDDAKISKFLAKYTPEIREQLQAARSHLKTHFPTGFELVYDNYNALVFAIASSERASDSVVSVAGYPRWVTLFFLHGADLPDPGGVLEGSGSQVRSVRLQPPARLLEPAVQSLIAAAKAGAVPALESAPALQTLIKSVSEKQRARKPAVVNKPSSVKLKRAVRSGA